MRLSPFDAAHRRHTSFAQVIVAPLLDDTAAIEIDDDDIRIDTFRVVRRGRPAREQDRQRRAHHAPADEPRRVGAERAQPVGEQGDGAKILRSRLAERAEEEREAELARERGGVNMGFGGDAVRSYVLHPYQLVKDARTGFEMGNTQAVLDGDLDGFIRAYLLQSAGNGG